MQTSYEVTKDASLADLVDMLNISVESRTGMMNVPIFITTPEDTLGAAIIYLNFKRGKFDSITLIPYDTEEELKAAYILADA